MGLCCTVSVTFPKEELTKQFHKEVFPGDWDTVTPLCLDTNWENTRGLQKVEDHLVLLSSQHPHSLFTLEYSYLDTHPDLEGDWDVTNTYEFEGGDIYEHTVHYGRADL
jgi:hypothetical protein